MELILPAISSNEVFEFEVSLESIYSDEILMHHSYSNVMMQMNYHLSADTVLQM